MFPRWIDGPIEWEYAPQFGGSLDGMLTELIILMMWKVAQNVTGVRVLGAPHWIAGENPTVFMARFALVLKRGEGK